MSIIHGMDVYIATHISNMGADGFRIVRMAFIGNFDPKKFLEMQKKNPQLSPEEFEFLKSHATLVRELGMQANRTVERFLRSQSMTGITLNGGTANWGVLSNTEVATGRYLTEIEDSASCTGGGDRQRLKDQLFGGTDPIGKTIKIEGRPFTVIGVAKAKGSAFGQSQDDFVDIPVGTYFQIYGSRNGIHYAALALDHSRCWSRRRTRFGCCCAPAATCGPTGRHVLGGQLRTRSSALGQLTGAIAATAVGVVSVFMVVGGVVIMNIMLAVVTERTHEIGIRKSVGARRQDILNQFLVESSMLSGHGRTDRRAARVDRRRAGAQSHAGADGGAVSAVIVGVALSAVVGLFFGIYPAQRACQAGSDRSPEGGSMTLRSILVDHRLGARIPCASTSCARS